VVIMTVFWNLLSAMALGLAMAFFRFVVDSAERYKRELGERNAMVEQEENDLIFTLARERLREALEKGDSGALSIRGTFEQEIRDRIVIARPHGPLFFGAIDWLAETVDKLEGKDVLILRCPWLDEIDLSGAYALGDLIEAAKVRNVEVVATGMTARTQEILKELHELNRLGEEHMFSNFGGALEHAIKVIEERTLKNQITQENDRPSVFPEKLENDSQG